MTGARDHLDQHDERQGAGARRLEAGPTPARAIAGRDDPRLAHASAAGPDLLHLQRTAGNAAVSALVAPTVQRVVGLDEMGIGSNPYDAPATEAPTPGTGGAAPATGATGPGGPVTSDGATTTISGGTINLDAAMTRTDGVLRAGTIIADAVVASEYTPGAGNVW